MVLLQYLLYVSVLVEEQVDQVHVILHCLDGLVEVEVEEDCHMEHLTLRLVKL